MVFKLIMIREVHERDKQIFPFFQSNLHSSPLLPSSYIVLQPRTQGMFYRCLLHSIPLNPFECYRTTSLSHSVCSVRARAGHDSKYAHNVKVFISNYVFLKNNINVLFLIWLREKKPQRPRPWISLTMNLCVYVWIRWTDLTDFTCLHGRQSANRMWSAWPAVLSAMVRARPVLWIWGLRRGWINCWPQADCSEDVHLLGMCGALESGNFYFIWIF